MKWLLTTFLALLVLTALQPWLQKLGIGRLPGDLRFKINGREVGAAVHQHRAAVAALTLLAAAALRWSSRVTACRNAARG